MNNLYFTLFYLLARLTEEDHKDALEDFGKDGFAEMEALKARLKAFLTD